METKVKKVGKPPLLFIVICLAPAVLLTAYFIFWPTVQLLRLSFTNAKALSYNVARFIGLKNYAYMFTDRRFIQALQNTLKLFAVAPLVTVFGALVLAFMITQSKLPERGFYRTVFFFPSIISMVVISITWSFIFHPTMGLLNGFLKIIGLGHLAQPWIGNASTALWTIAAAFVWQSVGYFMVMHIAAIDSIPAEIYEAATIDGAGPVYRLFRITLPLIKNIVGITFVFSVSGILDGSFTFSSIMTNGGPNGASTVLLSYIYNQGIRNGEYGYGMAITAFTLTLAIGLSVISRFITGGKSR